MVKRLNWTRTKIRTILQAKGLTNFKVLRECGITEGFDNENKSCVVRISDLFVSFYSVYEIEIPIFEIDIMKVTIDYPYLNILIFTKNNQSLEFHLSIFDNIKKNKNDK